MTVFNTTNVVKAIIHAVDDGGSFVPVPLSSMGAGNITMGNVTLNVSTLATAAEQSNQTVLLTAIRDNTANITGGGGSTNITTLATLLEQQNQTTKLTNLTVEAGKHTSNLSAIANNTAGLANLTVQNNHTGLLQTIANNTAITTNITTLSTSAKQDQQNANLSLIANQTLGLATLTVQNNQTTLLTNLTAASANQSTSLTTIAANTDRAVFRIDNTPTLTTLNSTGVWIDTNTTGTNNIELVVALTTAATVPAVALDMDYSADGTAIVRTPSITGIVNRAVSLGIVGAPVRIRSVVTTAGVTLGAGAKVIITGRR